MSVTSSEQPAKLSAHSISKLLLAAQRQEPGAVDELLAKYRPYLRTLSTVQLPHFCKRREDESDMVQQTLLDATQGLAEFRGASEGEFEAWMRRLLERNILQSVRRHTADKRDARRETIEWRSTESAHLVWHSLAASGPAAHDSVFRGEAALQLAAALEQLPDDQRVAIELRFLGQQPLLAIAEYMQKTKGAVAGLLRRGVEQLRAQLPETFNESH